MVSVRGAFDVYDEGTQVSKHDTPRAAWGAPRGRIAVSFWRAHVMALLLVVLMVIAPVVVGDHDERDDDEWDENVEELRLARTIEWNGEGAPWGPFNATAISLADFRGDGSVQLVAQNDNGNVYVFDPKTGKQLAVLDWSNAGCTTSCYAFEGVTGPINSPVIGDMDGTGHLSIIVSNTATVLARFVFDPVLSTQDDFVFHKMWERRFNDYQSFTTMDASPVLADLTGDGKLEIVISTEQIGVFAARADGTILWMRSMSGGHATPVVADFNDDGLPDVVIANDEGTIFVLKGTTGGTLWWAASSDYVHPASVPGAPLVGDITGDGRPDVVVTARDAHDPVDLEKNHMAVIAFDYAGALLWMTQPDWAAPMSHTRSVLVEVKGEPVIIGGDWNTMGHKPGNWERVGEGHVYAMSAEGKTLWKQQLRVPRADVDPVIADVTDDDKQQVLIDCQRDGKMGLCAYNVHDGKRKEFIATTPWEVTRGAVVGDLFANGRFAFAVPVHQEQTGAIQVYRAGHQLDADFPGWGASGVPRGDSAAGSPELLPVRVKFTPSGNEWWVQTMASPDRALVAVSVQIDDGPWLPLTLYSWGGWAAPMKVPDGAVVRFRAVAEDGTNASSALYTWPSITKIGDDGGLSPVSGLNATFTPCCGSAWWVQVGVASPKTLATVEVSINGGPWIELNHEPWGWSRSLSAPVGATVVFRALSVDDTGAISAPYVWPQ